MNRILFFLLLLAAGESINAQSVGIGTTTPEVSAVLDLTSINKGLLPPRMSWAQIQAIRAPATGLIVFDMY
jgi:hypothetical protein